MSDNDLYISLSVFVSLIIVLISYLRLENKIDAVNGLARQLDAKFNKEASERNKNRFDL